MNILSLEKRDKLRFWCCVLFYILVFIGCVVFFTRINPIVLFDADDWTYSSYTRMALPLWGDWNPSRIFPEIFMSFCSSIAVYIINPIINDYIDSLSLAYGLVLSLFILLYVYCMQRYLRNRLRLPIYSTAFLLCLFLLFHFWAMRSSTENNHYFFEASDATCYFYYVIPNLLNASIVLFLAEREKYSFSEYNKRFVGFFIVGIYFSIFSNLFPASIIVCFSSYLIVFNIFKQIKNRKSSFSEFVKQFNIPLFTIILWLVSLIFEMSGGRAAWANDEVKMDIMGTAKKFLLYIFYHSNYIFVFFTGIVLFIGILLIIYKRKSESFITMFGLICCSIIAAVFNIMLCAKVHSHYIERTEILYCAFFYLFVLLIYTLSIILKKLKKAYVVFPFLIIVIFSNSFTGNKTFSESNVLDINSGMCKELDTYIIEQIKEAEAQNKSEMTLRVPMYSTKENWPQSLYFGDRIGETLYQHHIINNRITIEIEPDIEINKRFYGGKVLEE